jgi:hypothetical protein
MRLRHNPIQKSHNALKKRHGLHELETGGDHCQDGRRNLNLSSLPLFPFRTGIAVIPGPELAAYYTCKIIILKGITSQASVTCIVKIKLQNGKHFFNK